MTGSERSFTRRPEWVARATSYGLALSVAFTLVGMFILFQYPSVAAGFGRWLPVFMQAPTWVYMIAIPVIVLALSVRHVGWRVSLWLLVLGSVIGLAAELVGTSTGFPFGPYEYTGFLEPKVLGRVPILIPLSWYATAVLSYELASMAGARGYRRIVLTAVCMVLWDVALDPAMAYGFPVWEWQVDGFFYGMPALNLVGWLAISLVIAWVFEAFLNGMRITNGRYVVSTWLLGAALPLGISALRGMWTALLVGTLAITIPLMLLRLRRAVPNQTQPQRLVA
jgi:putative membrane protein